jgi:hypothetical protein
MAPTADEIAAAAARAQQFPPAAPAVQEETVEEPTITHHEPLLASGSAGAIVQKLVDLLAVNGHATNTITLGENPGRILDQSVMADVRAFVKEHEVTEPDLGIEGDFIGPNTWQALYDAAAHALELA